MQSERKYIGTLKVCNDLYFYERYGEARYVADFSMRSLTTGTIHIYAEVLCENAVLLKIENEKYLWINNGEQRLLDIKPSKDELIFVDKDTLVPYEKGKTKSKGKSK